MTGYVQVFISHDALPLPPVSSCKQVRKKSSSVSTERVSHNSDHQICCSLLGRDSARTAFSHYPSVKYERELPSHRCFGRMHFVSALKDAGVIAACQKNPSPPRPLTAPQSTLPCCH